MADASFDAETQQAFERVIANMGSVRIEAFDKLRALPQLQAYSRDLQGLAGLDKESAQFEAGVRDLQQRVFDDLDTGVARDDPTRRPLPDR